MSKGVVISAFDKTTTMVKPWAEAGYLCYCIDIQHAPGETREGNIIKVGADILHWLPPKGNIVASFWFVPCTDTAVSGARWFRDKGLRALQYSIKMWRRSFDLAELIGAPYFIENPISVIGSYEKPCYKFNPCDYGAYIPGGGDRYTKKTQLWTGNGFIMPDKKPVEPTEGSKMHLLPPSDDRADLRAATPEGFARAVFIANAPCLKTERG